MASNDSSLWNTDIINDLDNFSQKEMPDILEMIDEDMSENEEVTVFEDISRLQT